MIDSIEERPEIFIDLTSNRKDGRYSFEIRGHHPVARMACGFVRNATRHTLLDSYRRIRKQQYFNKITRLRAVG